MTRLGVDELGVVKLDEAREALKSAPRLVTVMHANNETGSIQPIAELAAAAQGARCARPHRRRPVGRQDSGEGGRPWGGPAHRCRTQALCTKGCRSALRAKGTTIQPVVVGAGHERGLRPGTENVASIVGLGAACAVARKTLVAESDRVRMLRDRLWTGLKTEIPAIRLNGHPAERLPNTLNVLFPGVRSSALLEAAPAIAASAGSACHEGGETASAVLLAMGVDPDRWTTAPCACPWGD